MYTYIPYRTVSYRIKDDSSIVLFFNWLVATYPPHGSQPGTAWHCARIPTLPSAPLQRNRVMLLHMVVWKACMPHHCHGEKYSTMFFWQVPRVFTQCSIPAQAVVKKHLWQTNVLSVRNQLWNRKAWTRCFKQTPALFPSWSTFVSKLAFDLRLSTESAEGRAKGWLPACAHGRKEMQRYLGTCTNILLLSETRVPRHQFHQLNHIGLLWNLWIVCGFIPHFLTREVPPTAILLALPAMNRDVRALSSKNDGSSGSRHSFMTLSSVWYFHTALSKNGYSKHPQFELRFC